MSNRTSSSAHQQEKVRRRNWRKLKNEGTPLLRNGLLKTSEDVQSGWMNQNKELRKKSSPIDIPTTSSALATTGRKKKDCMGNLLSSQTSSGHAAKFGRRSPGEIYLSGDEDNPDNKTFFSPLPSSNKGPEMDGVHSKKLNGVKSPKVLLRRKNGRFQSAQKPVNSVKEKGGLSEVVVRPVKHEGGKQIDSWIRRKFYIVENEGRPAEVYCTDFVHKAKHGDSKFRSTDESRLMKIVDRWREEWNHGVQMPLCAQDTRETYTFEKVCLFPNSKQNENVFELPKKYIALNEKRYVNLSPTNFEVRERKSLYMYEKDEDDDKWLHKQNLVFKSGHHTQIKEKTFLDVINTLEVDCYKNIHLALLEPLIDPVRNSENTDDDAECDICRMPEWEPGDEIVFCDGCNICVHQSCYGLDSVPTEEWLCTSCSLNEDSTPQPCIFCPIRGGAMKYTKTFETWSHILCALWLPEVRFGDVERREPITCVSEVPAERWQSKCCVCDTREGACITCTAPGCNTPFHVSCAQRGGLTLRIEHSAEKNSGVAMISLCRKHSFSSPHSEHYSKKKISTNSPMKSENTLDDMLQNFSNFVDCQNISERLDVSFTTITPIFKYWQIKRNENKCQPLINEPLDAAIVCPPRSAPPNQQRKQQSRSRSTVAGPSKAVLRQYEYIHTLRQNLEKARNLSYMISKREKTKKALVETFEETTLSLGLVLLNGTVPISQRRTDKLLELWDIATRGATLPEDETSQEEDLDSRETSRGAVSSQVTHVSYLPSSVSKKRRKHSLAAGTGSDVFEFRGSSSPAREEDSISNSGISTLTEYSLAVSNSDSNTLYEFDFENAASIEEAPKKKKNKKVLLHKSSATVMAPINYCKYVKKQKLPQLNEDHPWDGHNAPKRMCLRNKIF